MSAADDKRALTAAYCLSHPLRVRILLAMKDGETWTPLDLSKRLEEKLGNVSYHLDILKKADGVRQVKTEQRRGAVQHFYVSTFKIRPQADAESALDRIAEFCDADDGASGSAAEAIEQIRAVLRLTGRSVAPKGGK